MASKTAAKMWRAGFRPRTVLASALALGMMAGSAQAQEDSSPSFGQNVLRTLIGGGSARPDINYRERSPLVIPPARALPAPAARAATQGNPAWPNDPDKQAGGAEGPRSADASAEREARSLSPNEMRRGGRARGASDPRPHVTMDDNEMGRALRPHEMNAPTIFQSVGRAVGGGGKEKTVTFAGEPTRTRMTDPPTGYRTPASTQPYTPPKGTGLFTIPSFFDRGTDPNQ